MGGQRLSVGGDANYDGGHHDHEGDHDWGHDGDYSDHHNSDPSFSAAISNAGRDFGRVRSSAKELWNGFWD
jgi:hypothetical protein